MSFYPSAPFATLALQASTGIDGYALADSTATIISWTAPDDGNMHRFQIFSAIQVTSATTGGQVKAASVLPNGVSGNQPNIWSASQSVSEQTTEIGGTCGPGGTVEINQVSALTAGAATVWAEIWGS